MLEKRSIHNAYWKIRCSTLPPDLGSDSTERVAEKALQNNLGVLPIAAYDFNPHPPNGLILGYASYNERQIKEGVSLLKKVLLEKYD